MITEADERLTEDTLFLACTRPAMIAGVPMEAMGLNLMVTATVYGLVDREGRRTGCTRPPT